ncbi:MAG: ABC transporter ATP-binding protein [Burkholderiales bacterium]|nr:ABC transporter ATP-binding protein [Burkholderiales bacterium]
MTAGVEVHTLHKSFGPVKVLDGIDLRVKPGEFLSLLGPSGCGKSTLLRSIAGLEEADAGQVHIAGRCVDGLRPRDRDIAFVFQNYALYPHMTVQQNVALPLVMRRLGLLRRQPGMAWFWPGTRELLRDIDAQVQALAQTLGLQALLQRRPGQLSGGQRQRVALARAMVRRPAVFLMDEPLSNLDAQLRLEVRDELAQLHQRLGATFVYVTHDQTEAMSLSSRVAVMERGRIQQIGTPRQLYDEPNSVAVARFIGSPPMNLLRLQPSQAGGVVLGTQRLALSARQGGARVLPACAGVRSEHLRLQPNGGAAAEGPPLQWPGRLRRVEHHGAQLHCHVEVPQVADEPLVCSVMTHELPAGLTAGAELRLGLAPQHLHFFDGDGARVACEARVAEAV